VLVGAAVALVVGLLAVVDADEEDRVDRAEGATTTTRQRPTTSTASANGSGVRPFTSPIALPAGTVIVGWYRTGYLDVLDPGAGTIRRTDLTRGSSLGLARVVPLQQGAVVVSEEGQASWLADRAGSAPLVPLASDVGSVFPSDVPGRIWVGGFGSSIQELDVTTGQSTASISLPFDAYLAGVADQGVIVASPGGVYLRRREAEGFERITRGSFIASSGSRVVYRDCDARLDCRLYLHDLERNQSTPLQVTVDLWVDTAALSPDGQWLAAVGFDPETDSVVPARSVINLSTGAATPTPFELSQRTGPAAFAWTPDSQWVLWPEDSAIHALRPADGTIAVIEADGVYEGVAVAVPTE
jgi:hypothetical protein